MTGAITWEQVVALFALFGAVAGIWWRIETRIRSIEQDLAAYKLLVAERYASQEHLKEVETRLVTAIDKLATQLDTMPDRLSRIIQQAIKDGRQGG